MVWDWIGTSVSTNHTHVYVFSFPRLKLSFSKFDNQCALWSILGTSNTIWGMWNKRCLIPKLDWNALQVFQKRSLKKCEDNGCRICGYDTDVVTNFPSYLGKTLRVNASITIQNKACSPKILVTAIPLLFFRKRSHPLLATASFSHYGNSLWWHRYLNCIMQCYF